MKRGPAAADGPRSLERYRAALPRPLGGKARFAILGRQFRMAVPIPASLSLGDAYFFPLTDGAIEYSAAQSMSRRGDLLIIETEARPGRAPQAVEGVLALGDGTGLQLTALPGSVPAAGPSCVDAPRFARGFCDFPRRSASIGRVSGLLMWLAGATGRYAVRT